MSSNVIFGHVVSGRNLSLPDIEKIIGPCNNVVPVRVDFNQTSTVLDLLTHIQE
jgi:non-ribosomal peptide synthetase component F